MNGLTIRELNKRRFKKRADNQAGAPKRCALCGNVLGESDDMSDLVDFLCESTKEIILNSDCRTPDHLAYIEQARKNIETLDKMARYSQ